ncbi:MAG: LPS assembly lipoprotein LptE [Deltaproteobacteria bacterium]|nr:LPS assembly lipoprotein LptE [Deltaproteobacteria bacterium]
MTRFSVQPLFAFPRTPRFHGARFFTLTGLLLLLGGCGYAPEATVLPGGAYRIWLAPVENVTSQAEVDVILREKLRRMLLSRPTVMLVGEEESRVILKVIVFRVDTGRALSTDSTGTARRHLVYTAYGRFTLSDRVDGRLIIRDAPVTGSGQSWLPTGQGEPPAARQEALDSALAVLAAQVEQGLFLSF